MTREQATAFAQFKKEIKGLDGHALLDKWIAFYGGPESMEPDLGPLKSTSLESFLIKMFGSAEWRDKVEGRKAKQDADDIEALKTELAEKKGMLGEDAGKVTLDPDRVTSLRMRVAALEVYIMAKAPR
jgi:hypothetical protein